MGTNNFINDYHLKIFIIEDKFSHIKPAISNMLLCKNIYEIKIGEDGINLFDNEIKITFDTIMNGIFVLDPSEFNDKSKSIIMNFFNIKKNKWQFDLFLIDLKLSEKDKFDGRQILNEFKKSYPNVPVFVFTWRFDKDEIIKEIKDYQADYYVHKSEIRELNEIIEHYYEENFGEAWLSIRKKDKDLSYLMRKCILTWRRNPKLLWHGEKTMHLVDHTYNHSEAMYSILNKMIKAVSNSNIIDTENLFDLSMAIWLHDIGLKGNKDTFWCYDIRRKHPIISGDLIFRYPEIYFLLENKEETNQKIKIDEFKKDIALVCAYHLYGAPLTFETLEIDKIKERANEEFKYPTKYEFFNSYAESLGKFSHGQFLTLELLNKKLLLPASLLRLFDVLDKGIHRVGILGEEDIKLNVCLEDARSLINELNTEISKIGEQLGALKSTKDIRDSYYNLQIFCRELSNILNDLQKKYETLNNSLRKKIDNGWESVYLESYHLFTEIKKKKDDVCRHLRVYLSNSLIKNCISILDQIIFYLETPLHFITHRTFQKDIEFRKNNNNIEINYYFNEDFVKLKEKLEFADFNRLFQESWKVFSDIFREFQPLEKILNDKIKFEGISFGKSPKEEVEKEEILFTFNLSKNYAEKEIKLKFEDRDQRDRFIKEFSEKMLRLQRSFKEYKVNDIFFDFGENKNELKKRGWSFRKREMIENNNNNTKIIWGIKIEPLYWKGEYEYRLEVELPRNSDDPNKMFTSVLTESENTPFKKVPNGSFNFIINKVLNQKCIKYSIEFLGKPIEMVIADVCLVDNSQANNYPEIYYYIEIEAPKENLKPWEQERIIEDLLDKMRAVFPNIDKLLTTKTKLDWALERDLRIA